MRWLANRDAICAALLLLFSGGAWVQASALSPKAAMFPRLVTLLMLAFSAIYLIRSLLRAPITETGTPFFTNATRFIVALVLIATYVLIFPRVGFFTATLVFVPVFSIAIGFRKLPAALLGSAVFTLGAWLIFVGLLGRRLPPEVLLTYVTGGGM